MLNGALIIDKEQGMTSADVVFKIKKKYHLNSVGHTGTLDPMATGVLVVLVGKATRLQHLLMAESKEYKGVICLGSVTDTDDITGQVIKTFVTVQDTFGIYTNSEQTERSQTFPSNLYLADFPRYEESLKAKFTGKMMQVPPVYSAVHVDGKRAYTLARANQEVSLPPREIEIYGSDFKFVPVEGLDVDKRYFFDVGIKYNIVCSKGTYIRSVARDVGEFLECGAALGSIRRLCSGKFKVANADKSGDLTEEITENKSWLNFDELVSSFPKLMLSQDEVFELSFGRQEVLERFRDDSSTKEAVFNLVDENTNHSIGLAEMQDGKLRVRFML